MEKHQITKIHITLTPRQSFRSGRIWWRARKREEILKILKFLHKVLPVGEIKVYDQRGKIYKKAKNWKVRSILIILSEPLRMSHKEEYEKIYKPIFDFFWENEFAIYNMWGHSPKLTPWQMDGRHAW